MRKLGTYYYALISQAVKVDGSFDPNQIFFYFEEQLPYEGDDSQTIWDFLEWCHREGKRFGHGNYEQVFKEFLND